MSYIIQIETATTSCSVALATDGQVKSFKEINARNVHAEVLTLFIDELVQNAGLAYSNIEAIAVSCGPGSYTGLRIGVSTAKGLCYALDKPLIAVNTLSAMANGAADRSDADMLLCPMIDARRMEVYTAVYKHNGELVQPVSAKIIDDDSFAELLQKHKVLFFGDGAEKCRSVLSVTDNAVFLEGFANSAVYMTQLAAQKFKAGDFEDVAYFEPYYLKDFIAGKQ